MCSWTSLSSSLEGKLEENVLIDMAEDKQQYRFESEAALARRM